MKTLACVSLCLFTLLTSFGAEPPLVYEGVQGPGKGKHIVFLAGDEEYRSEEALPMMAKILAVRHGFRCTVLFSLDPDGTISPLATTNLPGMEVLRTADLCFMKLRFRDLPDDQMVHFVDYVNSGKPLIALRTSTHAFAYKKNPDSKYAKYDWRSKEWPGGFGQQVLGETWINHHGDHNKQSTRGIVNTNAAANPILRGVQDIWGPSDVYGVIHLPENAQVLVWGQVLAGMKPEDAPVDGPKNKPMMPLVWLRDYKGETGKTSRVLTSTIGAAVDLQSEDLRRLLVNACYNLTGLEVPARADVNYVGEYRPLYFGFGTFKKGVRPGDLRLP
jgi:hypothetical protein